MPDAFFTTNGRVRAISSIRRTKTGQPQSLNAAIPDGDTAAVHIEGNGSVRFLGIDSPEKSFELKGKGTRLLDSAEWEAYLTDPFALQPDSFSLNISLVTHLRNRLGSGVGENHAFYAKRAEKKLQELIQSDMDALNQDTDTFRYFLSFSFDVFDSYGRFLAFINRNQPDANEPSLRPLTYNERMLEQGAALPYFIWPNIDPFRGSSLLDVVIRPRTAGDIALATPALRRAREFVKQARVNGFGVFDPEKPLQLEAFEIRYLGRQEIPNRAVIDLSRNDDVMLNPQSYFKIPNPEDRLFIPAAFIPLFVSRGWKLEGWF